MQWHRSRHGQNHLELQRHFRTAPLHPWPGETPPDADEEIIEKVGHHVRKQVAFFTEKRIALRGEKENLYFVDKRKLKRGQRFGPDPIPSPGQKLKSWLVRS